VANPCIGCGLELDGSGNLVIAGIRETRPNGITPQQWPYQPGPANPNPEVYPSTSAIETCNGLNCDTVTGEAFAWPNTSARVARGESSLIAAEGGPLSGFIFSWGLDTGSLPAVPWTNDGVPRALSTELNVVLSNPSSCRPMYVEYRLSVGPRRAALDQGVSVATTFLGNVWDDPAPYPGDVPIGFPLGNIGFNGASPASLTDISSDGSTVPLLRNTGPGVLLSTFLAPNATTNFRVKMMGTIAVGSATPRAGQRYFIGGGFNTYIIGVHV